MIVLVSRAIFIIRLEYSYAFTMAISAQKYEQYKLYMNILYMNNIKYKQI